MKKLYIFVILSIIFLSNKQLNAQSSAVPEGIIFQAVATDPQGNPAAGRTIYIKDAILQSTANGQIVYSESFQVTSSNTGVFTIVIGKGQKLLGPNSINNLDWSNGPFFLNIKAAVAPSLPLTGWNADQQYIDMGTSQFWSVPFALYASNVAGFDLKLNISDTTNMLKQYLRKSDTASLSSRIDANNTAVAQETTRAKAAELLMANGTDLVTALSLKENVANKSTATILGTSDVLFPSQKAVKTYVDAQINSGATVDATGTTKGKIQLAGDLGGTAAAPTVPGLALKANTADVTSSLALKADAIALGTTNVTVASNKTATDASIATTNGNVSALNATVASNKTATDASIATTNTTVASNNAATQTALNLKANTTDLTDGLALKSNATDVASSLSLKENVANKSTSTTLGISDVLYPSQNAVKTYVDAQINSGATVDATGTTKGKIQLTGDLGGTAAAPTVPGLALKANTTDVTSSLALKADASALATTNATVASNKTATDASIATTNGNVSALNATVASNKTATDASIATTNTTVASNNAATQTALNLKANTTDLTDGLALKSNATDVASSLSLKENVANKSTSTTLGISDVLYPSQNAVKTYVDAQINSGATVDATGTTKGKIQLAGDLGGTAAAPTVPGLALKANTTDVTASLLLKADAIALATTNATVASNKTATDASIATTNGNVSALNATVASNKTATDASIATTNTTVASNNAATQTALNLKANTTDLTDGLALKSNATDVASSLSLKENVANKSTSTTLGISDVLYPSQNAVKTYVDAQIISGATVDATGTTKGKIQLAGDLGGTAAAPTVPGLALKANTADVTSSLALKADAIALGTTNTTVASNKTATDASIATTNGNVSALNATVASNKTATDASIATTNTTVASNNAATQTALNLKANTTDLTDGLALKSNATDVASSLSLKENVANKSTSTTLGISDVLYPSQNAVKTYVDAQINSGATVDATGTTKGKIQLAGDLGGTAAAPTVPGLALKANTTDVTASLLLKADAIALATTNATVASNKTATDASIATTNGNVSALNATVASNKTATDASIATTNTTVASNNAATQTALNLKANTTDLTDGLALKSNATDVASSLSLKENVANKSTSTTLGISDVLYPSQNAVKTYVDAQINSGATVDATGTTKGKIQLAGDLGGTAAAPTVPGLALKANTADVTSSLALKADASALATTNATVASNMTTTQTALNLKANIASPSFTGTVSGIDKTMVGLSNADNTSDVNKPISAATQTALNLKANTTDLTDGLALKSNATDVASSLSLKENVANKSTSTTLGISDVLYPSQNAVKTYVDAQITSGATVDATATTKGKIQLAGDLGGTGTSAASPIISDNAITTVKIVDANVTDAKISTVSGSKINGNISGNADNVTGIVAVANGGTGASTKSGAFDALSPLTTSGDILYGATSGTGTRLGIGTDGQILTLASGLPTWASNSGVPYTGANASVDLGAHDLKVNGLTIGLGNGQNSENTAIGGNALGQSNSSGSRNTAIGSGAMLQYVGTSFDNNTSVGYNNLIGLTTGASNTSVGGETMFNVGSASFNTAIGNHTLMNTTSNQNTALGADAGNTVSSGSQNTLLGANADVSIGTLINATAIGNGALVSTSNTIQLGNTSVTYVNTSGTLTAAAANLAAGTTSIAPIKLTAGTNLTTPISGAIEYDGTNLYYTNSSATRQTIATNASVASASGSTNYISKFTGASALGSSLLYDDGTNVAIGTTSPSAKFQIGSDGNAENYKWGVMNGYNTLQLGYRQTGWKLKTNNNSGVVTDLVFSKTDGTTDNDYLTILNGGDITVANNLNVTSTINAANTAFTNFNVGNGNVTYSNTTGFFGIKSGGPTSLFHVGGNNNFSYSFKFDDDGNNTGAGGTLSLGYRTQSWKINAQSNSGNISDLRFLLNDGSDHELMRLNTSGTLTLGAITLPKTDGTSGQVLSTNGSGVVGWTNNGPSGNQTANFVYAAPNGSAGTPSFRSLLAADISNATTVGQNFVTLTNPSAISFPQINADNSISALTASAYRTAIGVGTFNLPSLTTGSVLFSDGSTIAQSNSKLYWDNTNYRLGIGTSAPSFPLHVLMETSGSVEIPAQFEGTETNGGGVMVVVKNNNITTSSYSGIQMQAGDNTHGGTFFASRTSSYEYGIGNGISFRANEGQDIVLSAASSFGSQTVPSFLLQGSNGKIGIQNASPSALLTLGTAGMRAGNFSMAGATSGTQTFQVPNIAGALTWTYPSSQVSGGLLFDAAGNGVLTETAISSIAVPYTGATGSVNLGAHDLTVNTITVGLGHGSVSTNTAIGNSALSSNTTGQNNTVIGSTSMGGTTGSQNTAIGANSLQSNSTGSNNTAIGFNSLTSGEFSNNTATGVGSLNQNGSGNGNTANGYNSLMFNSTGTTNTGMGQGALYQNRTGNYNSALGGGALSGNQSGNNNIGFGFNAGQFLADGISSPTAIDNSVLLGTNSSVHASGETNQIVIGYNAVGNGSNTIQLGNTDITDVKTSGTVSVGGAALTSDRRLKKNIIPLYEGLATIMLLNPVHYNKKISLEAKEYSRTENGFIAQELQKVLPFVVKEGTDKDKLLSVDYNSIIPILTKGMQEQQTEILAQQKKIDELKALVEKLINQKQ